MLIVDWQPDQAAGHDDVMALVKVLLRYGAERVAVWPSDVDFSQHTLDEIHGIDANNRDCALSRIVEPVVGSLDNQGLFSVCCGAIVVYDAVGTKALSNRFGVELVDVVEKTGRKQARHCLIAIEDSLHKNAY